MYFRMCFGVILGKFWIIFIFKFWKLMRMTCCYVTCRVGWWRSRRVSGRDEPWPPGLWCGVVWPARSSQDNDQGPPTVSSLITISVMVVVTDRQDGRLARLSTSQLLSGDMGRWPNADLMLGQRHIKPPWVCSLCIGNVQ